MNSCVEYLELISAYADGELPVRDKQRVEEHLRECEHCAALLDLYREISVSVDDSCKNAPESLRGGVMTEIFSGRAFGRKRKPVTVRSVFMKFGPMAACFAILLAGVWFSYRLQENRLDEVQLKMTQMSGGAPSVSSPASAPEAADAGLGNTDAGEARLFSDNSSPGSAPDDDSSPESVTEDDSLQLFTDVDDSAAESESGATRPPAGTGSIMDAIGAPRFSPSPTDVLARLDESGVPSSVYASIKITGGFPEFLNTFENWRHTDGQESMYIYIPRGTAAPLLDEETEGVSVDIQDEQSEWVLVVYYPE